MFAAVAEHGITRRARELGIWELGLWNPRQFTTDNYRTVDDRPFGGGPGMVMLAEPLEQAIAAAKEATPGEAKVVHLSPQGKVLDHAGVKALALAEARRFGSRLSDEKILDVYGLDIELNAQGLGSWLDSAG